MESYLLQEWTTLKGDASAAASSVVQPAALWLDLAGASELTFYLEVSYRNASSPIMRFDTSPNRDPTLFRELGSSSLAASPTATVKKFFLYQDPTVPLARWVRWRVTHDVGGSVWEVMFRLSVMAYRR